IRPTPQEQMAFEEHLNNLSKQVEGRKLSPEDKAVAVVLLTFMDYRDQLQEIVRQYCDAYAQAPTKAHERQAWKTIRDRLERRHTAMGETLADAMTMIIDRGVDDDNSDSA